MRCFSSSQCTLKIHVMHTTWKVILCCHGQGWKLWSAQIWKKQQPINQNWSNQWWCPPGGARDCNFCWTAHLPSNSHLHWYYWDICCICVDYKRQMEIWNTKKQNKTELYSSLRINFRNKSSETKEAQTGKIMILKMHPVRVLTVENRLTGTDKNSLFALGLFSF